MDTTYQIGSITGAAGGNGESENASPDKVRDYREVFNPRDTGQMVDRTIRSEPADQTPNYLEIARLVRPKKSAA